MSSFKPKSFAAPRERRPANRLVVCANKGVKTQLGAKMKPLAWAFV